MRTTWDEKMRLKEERNRRRAEDAERKEVRARKKEARRLAEEARRERRLENERKNETVVPVSVNIEFVYYVSAT